MKQIKQIMNEEGEVFVSIFSDPEQSLLMDIWNGNFGEPDNVAAVLAYSLGEVAAKKHRYWLSDVSTIDGPLEKGSQAAIRMFELMLDETRLQKFAFVTTRKASAERRTLVKTLAKKGIEVGTFATYPAAMEWLLVPDLSEEIWDGLPVINF